MRDLCEYLAGLDAAYQGEFFGLAMYSLIADSREMPDEKEKWHCLVQLEDVTRQVLAPVCGVMAWQRRQGRRAFGQARQMPPAT